VESLLRSRLTPLVALVRERRSVTAQAGDASPFPISNTDQSRCWKCGRARPAEMTRDSHYDKHEIRWAARRSRRFLDQDERAFASEKICGAISTAGYFRRAGLIACYLPTAEEVDTWPLIERAWRMKKRVFAPITKKNQPLAFAEICPSTELIRSDYGLLEPSPEGIIAPRNLDLCITPLVAFDSSGNRIGMGGGYYDRTFRFLRGRDRFLHPKLVGVAFDCQRVEKIHASAWDIRLFQVVTETGPIR
jgi:5-formyltetrahydrofolate cyclo-ligase